MKRIVAVLSLLLVMAAGTVSAKEWKKVRIGVEGAYPPFSFVKPSGELDGFDIEIAQLIAEVQKGTSDAVAAMSAGSAEVETGARLAVGEMIVDEALRMAGHDEFPFRLRRCDAGSHELHLGREIDSPLLLLGLNEMLRTAGFSSILVRVVPELSGYFDRSGIDPKT